MARAKKDEWIREADGVYRLNGRRKVRWWEPDGKGGGKRRQETLPEGTSLAEAKAYKGRMEELKKQQVQGPRRDTCDGFAKRWMDDYPRPEEETRHGNTERTSKFADDFAGVDLRDVDAEAAHRWGMQNRGRVKAVKAMFNDAVKYGYADENPFAQVKPKNSRGRKDIVVLTEAEINRLVEIALEGYGPFGRMIAGSIGSAAWTGLRPGELFGLRPEHIDYKNGEIHVLEQVKSRTGKRGDLKTHEQRVTALLPQAEAYFKMMPRDPKDERVVFTQRGAAFNSRAWHYYWNPIRKTFWSGLPANRKASDSESARRLRRIPPDFDFYELRHFFGSYLANELQATPYDIAKQMGHQDGGKLAMRLYIHTEQSESNDRIRAMARLKLHQRPDAATG